MKHIHKNRYAWPVLLLLMALCVGGCVKEDNAGFAETDGEDITIKLTTGTRAADNALVRNNDDCFSSLAVYAFDEGGNFLALRTYNWDTSRNSFTTSAFNCGISVRKLVGIANYDFYTDLKEKLVKGLSEGEVKKLVANGDGSVSLGANNILMTGESRVTFSENSENEDEEVPVNLVLRRLAARVDVFVFKDTGWNSDVQILDMSFDNGVKNTTLTYTDTEEEKNMNLPSSLIYAVPVKVTFSGVTSLEKDPGEEDWDEGNYLRGSFYTYRTERTAPVTRLNITVKIDNNARKNYSAVIADEGTGRVALDAGTVYQVRAVLKESGEAGLEYGSASWEDVEVDVPFN